MKLLVKILHERARIHLVRGEEQLELDWDNESEENYQVE